MSRPASNFILLNSMLLTLISHCDSCKTCDKASFEDKKVIAWRYAKPGEFPWAASLQWKLEGPIRHFCGASLAQPNVVLTACHCMMERSTFDNSVFLADPKDRIVVAGSINNNRADTRYSSRVSVNITGFKPHPKCINFKSNSTDVIHGGWDYDLGLAYTAKNLTFDGFNLGPFQLPSYDPEELKRDMMEKMIKNAKCLVIGWGRRRIRKTRDEDPRKFWPELTVITVEYGINHISSLDEVKLICNDRKITKWIVSVVSREVLCPFERKPVEKKMESKMDTLFTYSTYMNVDFIMYTVQVSLKDFAACYNILCGFHKLYCDIDHYARRQVCATTVGDLEVCQGDSGGPLLCGEKFFLYGVVGWGPNCGEDKGVPSVYETVYDGWDFIIASLGQLQAVDRNSKLGNSSFLTFAMAVFSMAYSVLMSSCNGNIIGE